MVLSLVHDNKFFQNWGLSSEQIQECEPSPHGLDLFWGFHMHYSPNLYIIGAQLNSLSATSRPSAWYCESCLPENSHFVVGEPCLCRHLGVTSLLLCISAPNPEVYQLYAPVLMCKYQLLTVIFSSSRCMRSKGFALTKVSCSWIIIVTLLDYVWCTRVHWTHHIVCLASCPQILPEFDISEQLWWHIKWSSRCRVV